MRVFKHIFIEISKNGEKEIIESGDINLYAKVDDYVVGCELCLIKPKVTSNTTNEEDFEIYIKYADDEIMHRKVSIKDIIDGYKEKGMDVEAKIKYDYFVLTDSFKNPPSTVMPGDYCYLCDIIRPEAEYYATFTSHKVQYIGANDHIASFIAIDGNIPIDVDYRNDNVYLIMPYHNRTKVEIY